MFYRLCGLIVTYRRRCALAREGLVFFWIACEDWIIVGVEDEGAIEEREGMREEIALFSGHIFCVRNYMFNYQLFLLV